MPSVDQCSDTSLLDGERIAFVGKLAGMSRREARKLIRQHGAVPLDKPNSTATLIVLGEQDLPFGDGIEDTLDDATRRAAERGRLEVVSETQLWHRLGLVDVQQHIRRYYTPAMLADLLDVPVGVIRRWHRKGVIVPTREVRRLPYFDYQEVARARRLAELLAAGCSPEAIEKKLADLARLVPHVQRPLAQLSVIVEGKQLLVRRDDGLTEPGGQRRFDFVAGEQAAGDRRADRAPPAAAVQSAADMEPAVVPPPAPDQMLALASRLEEQGQFEAAAEMYRAVLAAAGPQAEVHFLLAELLYRMGELGAARERYYAAVELDEDYVEARANLGCVLAEMGQCELAVAAFEGALAFHGDYPDAHFHLARTLDELGRHEEAVRHWQAFLALVPEGPWSERARDCLAGNLEEPPPAKPDDVP